MSTVCGCNYVVNDIACKEPRRTHYHFYSRPLGGVWVVCHYDESPEQAEAVHERWIEMQQQVNRVKAHCDAIAVAYGQNDALLRRDAS